MTVSRENELEAVLRVIANWTDAEAAGNMAGFCARELAYGALNNDEQHPGAPSEGVACPYRKAWCPSEGQCSGCTWRERQRTDDKVMPAVGEPYEHCTGCLAEGDERAECARIGCKMLRAGEATHCPGCEDPSLYAASGCPGLRHPNESTLSVGEDVPRIKDGRREPCPATCHCLCHDTGGSDVEHPGEPCPGKLQRPSDATPPPDDDLHTFECVAYAARTRRSFCIAPCADARRKRAPLGAQRTNEALPVGDLEWQWNAAIEAAAKECERRVAEEVDTIGLVPEKRAVAARIRSLKVPVPTGSEAVTPAAGWSVRRSGGQWGRWRVVGPLRDTEEEARRELPVSSSPERKT